ncbi:MAG TPA: hypothetical protein VMK32_06895 [Burkholderiaceae bacterium]|nr:hypothetical protein [Burkholderiaceae bacterium]
MIAARTPNTIHRTRTRTPPAKSKPAARRALDWNAKLRPGLEPEIVIDKRYGDRLLLPTPLLIAGEIAAIPSGATLAVSALRRTLAARFGADRTCPLMTGMFLKIIAGAVADDLVQRHPPRWPVWRVVGDDGRLSTVWPLDALYRATRLREEGVKIGRKGDAWQVLGVAEAGR